MTTEFGSFEQDMKKLVAELYSIEDSTGVMDVVLKALGNQLDSFKGLVDDFTTIFDVDKCEAKYLPYLAHQFGWELDTNLTEYLQRKIVKLLMAIYREKGTKQGIISMIYLMLGITVKIRDINDYRKGWRIGVHRVGVNTYIWIGQKSILMYLFFVDSPCLLSDSQYRAMDILITWCRPIHTHHIITQPGDSRREV